MIAQDELIGTKLYVCVKRAEDPAPRVPLASALEKKPFDASKLQVKAT
jgi:hypothetical protein